MTASFISFGAVHIQKYSTVKIVNSLFTDNLAVYGGAIRVYVTSASTIINSTMERNRAILDGGVLGAYKESHIDIQGTILAFNAANFGGGLVGYQSILRLESSNFLNNSAQSGGVMRFLVNNSVTVVDSNFQFNKADSGGVLYTEGGDINIQSSVFTGNEAFISGGVLYVTDGGNVNMDNNCIFV